MKKQTLVVCLVSLLFSITSFAQESTQSTYTIPTAVLAIPSLKAQAEKIQLKEQQLFQAASSSRGVFTQQKQELTDLRTQYKALLSNEIKLANEASRKELEAELAYVEQQLAAAAVPNQR